MTRRHRLAGHASLGAGRLGRFGGTRLAEDGGDRRAEHAVGDVKLALAGPHLQGRARAVLRDARMRVGCAQTSQCWNRAPDTAFWNDREAICVRACGRAGARHPKVEVTCAGAQLVVDVEPGFGGERNAAMSDALC